MIMEIARTQGKPQEGKAIIDCINSTLEEAFTNDPFGYGNTLSDLQLSAQVFRTSIEVQAGTYGEDSLTTLTNQLMGVPLVYGPMAGLDDWQILSAGKEITKDTLTYIRNGLGASAGGGGGGCYIATCVYGTYDCPEVWTLRRFRDEVLANYILGKAFIYSYYAVSPRIVSVFGDIDWFKRLWKFLLDNLVKILRENGISNKPYKD